MMATVTPQQQRERVQTLTEVARLDLSRHLIRSGTTLLERLEVKAALRDMLNADIDQDAADVLEDGASFADVGRAVGMTRHGVRKRYGHLEVVS